MNLDPSKWISYGSGSAVVSSSRSSERNMSMIVLGYHSRQSINSQLIKASAYGDLEEVQNLLKAGANIDATDIQLMTPLAHAVRNGHSIDQLTRMDSGQIIRLLISQGANLLLGNLPTINSDKTETVEYILSAAEARGQLADFLALSDEYGSTFFHTWAHRLHRSFGQALGCCPQTLARYLGLLDRLSRPASVQAVLSGVNMTMFTKNLAALVLSFCPWTEIVDAQNRNGKTPLMIAASSGTVDRVRLFIEAGADPNLKDTGDKTAADYVRELQSNGKKRSNKAYKRLEDILSYLDTVAEMT